jgi:hypothetical protein
MEVYMCKEVSDKESTIQRTMDGGEKEREGYS